MTTTGRHHAYATNRGDTFVLAGAAALVAAAALTWTGAALTAALHGHRLHATLTDAASAWRTLPATWTHPQAAWPAEAGLTDTNPWTYWTATTAVIIIAAGTAALTLRHLRRRPSTHHRDRHPLGPARTAGFARPADLRPLIITTPQPGRLILGTAHGHLLATEHRNPTATGRVDPRAGDRGAVALIGPSRSGKTTAIISAVLDWHGPAILASVKDDLLRATIGHRAAHGAVHVFDPTDTTGHHNTAWSPLRDAATILGAQRAARALVDAAPRSSTHDGIDFWMAQAEQLLTSLLFCAHHTGTDMGTISDWIITQDRPTHPNQPGHLQPILDHLTQHPDSAIRTNATRANDLLDAIWHDDDRTRSSVYATTRTVIWPWTEPAIATSSQPPGITLTDLLERANTLYLCAPIDDQARLAPAFGGVLNDLITQTYRHVATTGQPLDPPLLIVIDEAGNTPLRSLPEYASTLAGLGIVLVTIWQSIAQIDATYRAHAGTILANHLTKIFYAGISDPTTHRHLLQLLGDTELPTTTRTTGPDQRTTTQTGTTRAPLVPAHVLRQMRPGHALLIHGTLPPTHLTTRPYHQHPHLRDRANMPYPPRT